MVLIWILVFRQHNVFVRWHQICGVAHSYLISSSTSLPPASGSWNQCRAWMIWSLVSISFSAQENSVMSLDTLHLQGNPKEAETGLNPQFSTGAITFLTVCCRFWTWDHMTTSTTSVSNCSSVPKGGGVSLQWRTSVRPMSRIPLFSVLISQNCEGVFKKTFGSQ